MNEQSDKTTSFDLQAALSRVDQVREKARSRLRKNRNRIRKVLEKAGVTRVRVNYSGSGDSGQIDQVSLYKGEKEIVEINAKVSVASMTSKWDSKESRWIDSSQNQVLPVTEALRELVYDWLEADHGGWENNDGASGECSIDVAKDKFLLEHTTYIIEGHSTEHIL